MKVVGVAVLAALLSVCFAQDWLDDVGDFTVLGSATNGEGTLFLEVAELVVGRREQILDAMRTRDLPHVVIIDPNYVHVGYWMRGEPVYRRYHWILFLENTRLMSGLSLDDLSFTLADGPRLNHQTISAAQGAGQSVQPRTLPRPTYTAPASPRNGCVSNVTSTGSSMRCYTDGRLTYQQVCTLNSRTFDVSCRSDSYY